MPAAVAAPEHAHREFGAAGTHQAGNPDDLAAVHVQGGVRRPRAGSGRSGGARSSPRSAAPPRRLRGVRAGTGGRGPARPSPRMMRSSVTGVRTVHVEGLDGPAVAEDRGGVGDRGDLVELVAR